jgi:predicted amidohydrolase
MTKDRKSQKVLSVATVAMTPDPDPQISRDRMKAIIEGTKQDHPDVRLILFGETILGWFYKKGETREYHESIAETVPGTSTKFIAELAEAHDVYISFGLSEKATGNLSNTQVLISPQGDILAKHRKFLIRNKIFTAGDRKLTTAMIDGVKVAILVCADGRSLWLSQQIRRENADVVLASLADDETNLGLFQLFGVLFDAWLLVANRYDEEPPRRWHGLITITDPWIKLHASGIGKEQVLVHHLRVSKPTSVGRFLRRVLVVFKAIGVATVLVTQKAWASMMKKRRKSN